MSTKGKVCGTLNVFNYSSAATFHNNKVKSVRGRAVPPMAVSASLRNTDNGASRGAFSGSSFHVTLSISVPGKVLEKSPRFGVLIGGASLGGSNYL